MKISSFQLNLCREVRHKHGIPVLCQSHALQKASGFSQDPRLDQYSLSAAFNSCAWDVSTKTARALVGEGLRKYLKR